MANLALLYAQEEIERAIYDDTVDDLRGTEQNNYLGILQNRKLALYWMQKSAESDHPYSIRKLASWYLHNTFNLHDTPKSPDGQPCKFPDICSHYIESVEAINKRPCTFDSSNCPYKKAFDLQEPLADAGDPSAMFYLASLYEHGLWSGQEEYPKSIAKALYKKAALRGNAAASRQMAYYRYKSYNYVLSGENPNPNHTTEWSAKEYTRWQLRALAKGNTKVFQDIFVSLPKYCVPLLEDFKEILARRGGNPEPVVRYMRARMSIQGCPHTETYSLTDALDDLLHLSRAGITFKKIDPFLDLSHLLATNNSLKPEDENRAHMWCADRVQEGIIELNSILYKQYLDGIGTPVDFKKAFASCDAIANLTSKRFSFPASVSESIVIQAKEARVTFYAEGIGMEAADLARAFQLSIDNIVENLITERFDNAITSKNQRKDLKNIYDNNGNLPVSTYKPAVEWLKQCCDGTREKQGREKYIQALSHFFLAKVIEKSVPLHRPMIASTLELGEDASWETLKIEAFRRCKLASETIEYVPAQRLLAEYHEFGFGCEKNIAYAVSLYRKLAEAGSFLAMLDCAYLLNLSGRKAEALHWWYLSLNFPYSFNSARAETIHYAARLYENGYQNEDDSSQSVQPDMKMAMVFYLSIATELTLETRGRLAKLCLKHDMHEQADFWNHLKPMANVTVDPKPKVFYRVYRYAKTPDPETVSIAQESLLSESTQEDLSLDNPFWKEVQQANAKILRQRKSQQPDPDVILSRWSVISDHLDCLTAGKAQFLAMQLKNCELISVADRARLFEYAFENSPKINARQLCAQSLLQLYQLMIADATDDETLQELIENKIANVHTFLHGSQLQDDISDIPLWKKVQNANAEILFQRVSTAPDQEIIQSCWSIISNHLDCLNVGEVEFLGKQLINTKLLPANDLALLFEYVFENNPEINIKQNCAIHLLKLYRKIKTEQDEATQDAETLKAEIELKSLHLLEYVVKHKPDSIYAQDQLARYYDSPTCSQYSVDKAVMHSVKAIALYQPDTSPKNTVAYWRNARCRLAKHCRNQHGESISKEEAVQELESLVLEGFQFAQVILNAMNTQQSGSV